MSRIKLCNNIVDSDALPKSDLQALLREHHEKFKGTPPVCLCTPAEVKMYISRVGDLYVLKRWPMSKLSHKWDCPRYEAPLQASGLGKLMGSAITEDPINGTTQLKLGFSLKRITKVTPEDSQVIKPGQEADQKDGSVKSAANRLTTRAVLHYLWDTAHLSIWDPASLKRRNWPFVYTSLKAAASTMHTKGADLGGRIFIPEPWTQEHKDRLSMSRRMLMNTIASDKSNRDLMMFLVEVKDFAPAQFGHKMIVKQVPDAPFFMSESQWEAINKRFETEIDMFSFKREKRHLIAFGTISARRSGTINIEEIVLMMTNEYWIPISDDVDELLIDHSIKAGRHFIRPLRYNLGPGRCLANIIYRDTPGKPTSLYVTNWEDTEAMKAGRDELIASGDTNTLLLDMADAMSFTEKIDGLPMDKSVKTSAYASEWA